MPVSIHSKNVLASSNNIVVGFAELIAVTNKGRIHWELPGGGSTTSKPFAMQYAQRLNKMITRNMKTFKRDLLWS